MDGMETLANRAQKNRASGAIGMEANPRFSWNRKRWGDPGYAPRLAASDVQGEIKLSFIKLFLNW